VGGGRGRRPLVLVAGIAAAALVAAGVIIVDDGEDPAVVKPVPGAVPGRAPVLDAKGILLVAARTAEKEPVGTGKYWYVRMRTSKPISDIVLKNAVKLKRPKRMPLGFTADVSSGQESWHPLDRHEPARTVMNLDTDIKFANAADEATWKRLGSPDLVQQITGVPVSRSGQVNDYPGLTDAQIKVLSENDSTQSPQTLPTDRTELESLLRKEWKAQVKAHNAEDSFPTTVFGLAQDLLTGPVRPATRSALYRILADQPGITLSGKVTDSQGRPGTAVDQASPGGTIRLILDSATGRLLSQESFTGGKATGTPILTQAYLSASWVDKLGARP
jgi:hypothetical protein